MFQTSGDSSLCISNNVTKKFRISITKTYFLTPKSWMVIHYIHGRKFRWLDLVVSFCKNGNFVKIKGSVIELLNNVILLEKVFFFKWVLLDLTHIKIQVCLVTWLYIQYSTYWYKGINILKGKGRFCWLTFNLTSHVIAHSVDLLHIREHHFWVNSIVLNHPCKVVQVITY